MTRWDDLTGGRSGPRFAAHFARLAASGVDVDGEARLCASLVPAPARVLDAGCGTGRVAIRLASWGYDCVGVDSDASMLAEARRAAPNLPWVRADLATLQRDTPGLSPAADSPAADSPAADAPAADAADRAGFDLVVAAGNVIPLLAPGTEPVVVARIAALLRPGGLLVAGFGLDEANLPFPPTGLTLDDYDGWCTTTGLTLRQRFATWDRAPYTGGGYAVSVHSRGRRNDI